MIQNERIGVPNDGNLIVVITVDNYYHTGYVVYSGRFG